MWDTWINMASFLLYYHSDLLHYVYITVKYILFSQPAICGLKYKNMLKLDPILRMRQKAARQKTVKLAVLNFK